VNASVMKLSQKLSAKQIVLLPKRKKHPVRLLLTLNNARQFWSAKSRNYEASNGTTVHGFVHLSKTNYKTWIDRLESQTRPGVPNNFRIRSEEHTSELQSRFD